MAIFGRRRDHNANPAPFQGQGRGKRNFLSKDAKNHVVAMSGEFVGTVMFLWFAFGATQLANDLSPTAAPTVDRCMYIAAAFGVSLAVTAWCFYRVSGGLFNPAVSLGMCLSGNLPWIRGALLLPPQILGGMVAAGLVKCMFPGPMKVDTTLGPGVNKAQGLFIEMFLTSLLVFTVLMLAAEKWKATFMAPLGFGLALFVAELTGVYYTGGSLNPVRSFGPCVANRYFQGYHWIYWIGPGLGAALAAGYYRFAKWFDYEEANPDQDAAHQSFENKEEPGNGEERNGHSNGHS